MSSIDPPRYYGLCRGGPWNGKHMAHAFAEDIEPVFNVAIDMGDVRKRAIPGVQASEIGHKYKFGCYRFSQSEGVWIWDQSGITGETR